MLMDKLQELLLKPAIPPTNKPKPPQKSYLHCGHIHTIFLKCYHEYLQLYLDTTRSVLNGHLLKKKTSIFISAVYFCRLNYKCRTELSSKRCIVLSDFLKLAAQNSSFSRAAPEKPPIFLQFESLAVEA